MFLTIIVPPGAFAGRLNEKQVAVYETTKTVSSVLARCLTEFQNLIRIHNTDVEVLNTAGIHHQNGR